MSLDAIQKALEGELKSAGGAKDPCHYSSKVVPKLVEALRVAVEAIRFQKPVEYADAKLQEIASILSESP